jgi:hypothetical protein
LLAIEKTIDKKVAVIDSLTFYSSEREKSIKRRKETGIYRKRTRLLLAKALYLSIYAGLPTCQAHGCSASF